MFKPGLHTNILRSLFPVNPLAPHYMMDPEQAAPVTKDSDRKIPPKKEPVKKAASATELGRKKGSWSKKRTDSSNSLNSRGSSLKDQKGSRRFGRRRGSGISTHSASSLSDSGSKPDSLSRHSSSSALVSSASSQQLLPATTSLFAPDQIR